MSDLAMTVAQMRERVGEETWDWSERRGEEYGSRGPHPASVWIDGTMYYRVGEVFVTDAVFHAVKEAVVEWLTNSAEYVHRDKIADVFREMTEKRERDV